MQWPVVQAVVRQLLALRALVLLRQVESARPIGLLEPVDLVVLVDALERVELLEQAALVAIQGCLAWVVGGPWFAWELGPTVAGLASCHCPLHAGA